MTRKKIDDSPKTEKSVAGAKSGYDLIEASLAGFDHVVPIETVIPYENNPRDNTDAVDPVAKSLWECGWCNAIAVESLEKRMIVAGHTRLLAAQKLGLKRVPVKPLDHLTPDKIRLYRLLDNRTHEFSRWMEASLQTELDFLTQSDFDMSEFGFSDKELNQILRDEDPVTEGKTDPDSIPETPEEPVSVRGKVYLLGRHRLMCGDSTAKADILRLMNGQLADLWLADPPYNVDYEGKTESKMKIQNDHMGASAFERFLTESFTLSTQVMKPGASFYIFHSDNWGLTFRQAVASAGLTLRQCLIWLKNGFIMGRQDYQWAHEACLYGWRDGAAHHWYGDRRQSTVIDIENHPFIRREDGRWQFRIGGRTYTIAADAVCEEEITSVIQHPKPLRNDIHPTMKPVALLIDLLKHSCRREEIILDSFGGSGSTLIAAEQTGRIAFVMELDERFVDAIRKRYAEFTHGEGCDWQTLTPEDL